MPTEKRKMKSKKFLFAFLLECFNRMQTKEENKKKKKKDNKNEIKIMTWKTSFFNICKLVSIELHLSFPNI